VKGKASLPLFLALAVVTFCYLTMLLISRLYSVDNRMISEYGTARGMRIGWGDQTYGRKPAPVPLGTPQIPHTLKWDGGWAAKAESQRLTPQLSYGTARPMSGATYGRNRRTIRYCDVYILAR
jgi:hypothetical protein